MELESRAKYYKSIGKTGICHYWLNGNCWRTAEFCSHAHEKVEGWWKTKLCGFGTECKYSDECCAFIHTPTFIPPSPPPYKEDKREFPPLTKTKPLKTLKLLKPLKKPLKKTLKKTLKTTPPPVPSEILREIKQEKMRLKLREHYELKFKRFMEKEYPKIEECSCGRTMNYGGRVDKERHLKTLRHIRLTEGGANDPISRFKCGCGSSVRAHNKERHFTSQKHKRYILLKHNLPIPVWY